MINGDDNMVDAPGVPTPLFSGLRFFLASFEEEDEKTVAEELISNGGQIGDRYDASTTHVVVADLPHAHPICISARRDGKALVTDGWVADCLDARALVNVNNVLYRPLRDLRGIRGGDKLCICLTGYQGLIRKQIRRMVDSMGAVFSKPLDPTVVTHLICYKFEGEKYELAKRSRLLLVNHFWMEDCLKEWTLLPESGYAQSGWEAENMRCQGRFVEDSPEGDMDVSVLDETLGAKSARKRVASSARAGISNQKSGTDTLKRNSSEGRKGSGFPEIRPLEARHFSPTSRAARAGEEEIDGVARTEHVAAAPNGMNHTADVFEHTVEAFPGKVAAAHNGPDLEELPGNVTVEGQEKGSGSSMHDVQGDDETTDLFVEDENESDHSSGGTSHPELNQKSDGEGRPSEPGNVSPVVQDKMELSGTVSDQSYKRKSNSAEDLQSMKSSLSGCVDPNVIGSKRRCSRSSSGELPIEGARDPSVENPEDAGNVMISKGEECIDIKDMLKVTRSTSETEQSALKTSSLENKDDKGRPESATDSKTEEETSMYGFMDEGEDLTHEQGGHKTKQSKKAEEVRQTPKAGSDNQKYHRREKNQDLRVTSSPKPSCVDEQEIPSENGCPGPGEMLPQSVQTYKPGRRGTGYRKEKADAKDKENKTANELNRPTEPEAVKTKLAPKCTVTNARKILSDPSKMCFGVGGSSDDRKRLHDMIKHLGGKVSTSRYQWRDVVTHVVLPDPLRRTEKLLAGSAAGRWILKSDYLEASMKAGKFLDEEPYEWHGTGTNYKDSVSLQAPRKWRIMNTRDGVGAFHGVQVVFYGECISPPLGTLKRAIQAGGGLVLATAPPYARFLRDLNFAIISPGISEQDQCVQEFLKHDIACVTSEYFVDWICHPSSSLDKHILYKTSAAVRAARKEITVARANNKLVVQGQQRNRMAADENTATSEEDISCSVCGKPDGEELMLLCGDGKEAGCGIGKHIYCCAPPLPAVPEEDWFCSKCQEKICRPKVVPEVSNSVLD